MIPGIAASILLGGGAGQEFLVPNANSAGWDTGAFGDIDNGTSTPDTGTEMSDNTENGVMTLDFSATAMGGAQTSGVVKLLVYGDSANLGTEKLKMELMIGAVSKGATTIDISSDGVPALYTFTNAGWEVGFTQTEINGAQARCTVVDDDAKRTKIFECDLENNYS